jgi:WD domain, G-beta repeat
MAITEPAKKAGSKVDDDLVGTLLAEVRNGQPGAFGAGVLPLLSHALDQAWRCGTGETVTLADYERAGGIEGAVAESAQRAYDHLTPAQQNAARQIFTRLAATGSEGVDSAGRVTRADLTEGKTADEAQDVEEVLEAFAAERLLTLATDTVELSHEVLLTAWPLLRDTWLADTHADQIVRTRLHATAAEWDRHSRDPSYLYTGSLLHTATSAAAHISDDPAHHPPLSQTERDFLHASNYGRRRQTRRRQAFLTMVIALVGFASATEVAIRADQQVTHERDVAVSGQLTFESRFLGSTSRRLSTLLSIAAWQINPSGDARDAMLAAAARYGIAARGPTWHTGKVSSVAFSRDGNTLVGGSSDGIRLWNANTGLARLSPLTGRGGKVSSVAFSPDGNTLATGGADGIRLWDVTTGRQLRSLRASRGGKVLSVAFSPHGGILVGGSSDGIRLWDVATGYMIGTLPAANADQVVSIAFRPGGNPLASVSADGAIQLWKVAITADLVPYLCHHAGRSFTHIEWARYLPQGPAYHKICP